MFNDFKEFIKRGNVVDLAIGVIIGTAFSRIVSSIVNDLFMPIVGVILGGLDFSDLNLVVGDSVIYYGNFLNSVIDFVVFMALLSVNLGLINLFPIPVLDGGHVVFYTLEIISGRELNEKVKDYLFRFGLALLLALMIFATWNDIVHLTNRWFNT